MVIRERSPPERRLDCEGNDSETLPDGTTRADPQVGPMPNGYMIYGAQALNSGGTADVNAFDDEVADAS